MQIIDVSKASLSDQRNLFRDVESIPELQAISFFLGAMSAANPSNKTIMDALQAQLQERNNEIYIKSQSVSKISHIVNPELVNLSRMQLEEKISGNPDIKNIIINALKHPDMNLPTAYSIGHKIVAHALTIEKLKKQSHVSKYLNNNHENELVVKIEGAVKGILQNDALFNSLLPRNSLQYGR